MSFTLVPTELIVDGAITSAKLDTNISISGTLGVTGELTLATHLNMGDNDKIKIGTGGDLEIYHDGSNSYIANSTGNIYIADTNGAVHIQAKLNEESIVAAADGAVTLYHDNSAKLATASGGVTVTGTLTATTLAGTLSTAAQTNVTSLGTLTSLSVGGSQTDFSPSVTVNNTSSANGSTGAIRFVTESESTGLIIGKHSSGHGTADFAFINQELNADLGIFTNNSERMRIDAGGRVMIAETSNSGYSATADDLIVGDNGSSTERGISLGSTAGSTIRFNDGADAGLIEYAHSDDSMRLYTAGSERMRIDSSGNFGINQTSPAAKLDIKGDTTTFDGMAKIYLTDTSSNSASRNWSIGNGGSAFGNFTIGCSNAKDGDPQDGSGAHFNPLIITNTGKVGIGENSPSKLLHIASDTNYEGIQIKGAGHKQLTIESTQSSKQSLVTFTTASQNMSIGLETDNSFIFHSGTASAERVRIDTSGVFMVNTTGAIGPGMIAVKSTATNTGCLGLHNTNTGGSFVRFANAANNAVIGTITNNGNTGVAYNQTSDARLKNVTGKARGLEVISKLNPVAYNWKESGQADEGFIAQEVMKILPNVVSGSEEDMYQMDYSKLVTPLVKAIQEQQAIIEDLKTRIETLEG